jgi:hypothetical protein
MRLGGLQDQSGGVWKFLPLSAFNSWTMQPVANHYTDYAIQANVNNQYNFFVCSRTQVFFYGYIWRVIYLGEVRLVCLAPLTNIALTMKTFAHFSSSLKDIYVMGGNSTGKIMLSV